MVWGRRHRFLLRCSLIPAPVPSPTANSNSPVCQGANLTLGASLISGASYSWSGPNGFSSSAFQNPIIGNVQLAAGGTYQVVATVGGCPSAPGSVLVEVRPRPSFSVVSSVDPTSCGASDGSITLGGLDAVNCVQSELHL
jgi:large repetitive protein